MSDALPLIDYESKALHVIFSQYVRTLRNIFLRSFDHVSLQEIQLDILYHFA